MALKTIKPTNQQINDAQKSITKLMSFGLDQSIFGNLCAKDQKLMVDDSIDSLNEFILGKFEFDNELNIQQFFQKLKQKGTASYASEAIQESSIRS